jgi:hypothetical protein
MSYNGWTNYATWRVNLEVIDGVELRDLLGAKWPDVLEELLEEDGGSAWRYAAEGLRDYCTLIMELVVDARLDAKNKGGLAALNSLRTARTPNGVTWPDVVRMYAELGLLEVNWRELAMHQLCDNVEALCDGLEEEHGLDDERERIQQYVDGVRASFNSYEKLLGKMPD